MKKLRQLLSAARALAPQIEVRLRGTDNEDVWVCTIAVGGAVLFESEPESIEVVIDKANQKLRGMSQKMRKFLLEGNGDDSSSPSIPPPPLIPKKSVPPPSSKKSKPPGSSEPPKGSV